MGEWDIKSFSDLILLLYYCKRHRSYYIHRSTIVRGHDYTSSRLRAHTHTHTFIIILCGTYNNIIRTHAHTDMIKQWISTYMCIFFFLSLLSP